MTIKVDLLPTERKRFTFDPMLGFLAVIVIICTVGFVIYGSKLQSNIETEKQEVVGIEAEIKDIENSLPQIEDLKADIAKIKAEIKVIEGLVYDPVRYGNLLAEVGRVLPANVWVDSLAIEPGTRSITMSGTAAQMGANHPLATISSLLEKIHQSKIFNDASLGSTGQVKLLDGNLIGFTFQIEARYDPDQAAGLVEEVPAGGGSSAEADGVPAEGGAEAEAPPAAGEPAAPGT